MKDFAILILIFLVAWGSFFFLAIEISQNVGGALPMFIAFAYTFCLLLFFKKCGV